MSDRAVLVVHGDRLGTVRDIELLLGALDAIYSGIYTLELLASSPGRYDVSSTTSYEDLREKLGGRTIRWDSDHSALGGSFDIVGPSNDFELAAAQFASQGFWSFLGGGDIIRALNEVADDRDKRRRKREYLNREEEKQLILENEARQISNIKSKVEVLQMVGIRDDVIARYLTKTIVEPLIAIEDLSAEGIITACEVTPAPSN